MTKVDHARRLGEATLMRDALANEGIEAELRGEHRPALGGELPFAEARGGGGLLSLSKDEARLALLFGRGEGGEGQLRRCRCRRRRQGDERPQRGVRGVDAVERSQVPPRR